MAHELVIRGGTIVDGTGADRATGDVAVDDGRITAVGGRLEGDRTIDADGAVVTPGWVDVHTHYDGQATWDDQLDPSFSNGVTTLVMGNCGVGFAPCPAGEQATLIELMEGVEDIPGSALARGGPVGRVGELPGVPRLPRVAELRTRHRRPAGPRVAALPGDARARRAQRGRHRGRHRRDAPSGRRGRGRRRGGLLHLAHDLPPLDHRPGRARHLRQRRRAHRARPRDGRRGRRRVRGHHLGVDRHHGDARW